MIASKTLKKSPFQDFNEEDICYIKPLYKVKVKYLERTKSNHLRQPFIVN